MKAETVYAGLVDPGRPETVVRKSISRRIEAANSAKLSNPYVSRGSP